MSPNPTLVLLMDLQSLIQTPETVTTTWSTSKKAQGVTLSRNNTCATRNTNGGDPLPTAIPRDSVGGYNSGGVALSLPIERSGNSPNTHVFRVKLNSGYFQWNKTQWSSTIGFVSEASINRVANSSVSAVGSSPSIFYYTGPNHYSDYFPVMAGSVVGRS